MSPGTGARGRSTWSSRRRTVTEAARLAWSDWSLEPSVAVGLLTLCGAYAAAWRRGILTGGDDVSPWLPGPRWRPALFAAGIVTAGAALLSPIDRGGDQYLFSLHMVQHVLLMMVAPPLVLLGLCGCRFATPAGGSPLPGPAAARAWHLATRPVPATLIFTAVMLVWHVPALYDATLTTEPIHIVEHLTFAAAGVVFWWPVVDPLRGPGTASVSPFEKIAILVASGIPPTVLGLLFSLASHPFYDFYARAPRLWGLSPVADQQLAGVVMFGLGNVIYFVAVSAVFVRLFGDATADETEAAQAG